MNFQAKFRILKTYDNNNEPDNFPVFKDFW